MKVFKIYSKSTDNCITYSKLIITLQKRVILRLNKYKLINCKIVNNFKSVKTIFIHSILNLWNKYISLGFL